jgi:hypothetical protein
MSKGHSDCPVCTCDHGISWHGPEHFEFWGIRFKVARPCGYFRDDSRLVARCKCQDFKFDHMSRDLLA